MAPYRAIPRDYLSDTPLFRAMGFLVSQHGQLGVIPPPPFLSVFPLGEHSRSGGAIPPHTCAILYENKAKSVRYPPPPAILSRKGIARYGGVSRAGPLSAQAPWKRRQSTLKSKGKNAKRKKGKENPPKTKGWITGVFHSTRRCRYASVRLELALDA